MTTQTVTQAQVKQVITLNQRTICEFIPNSAWLIPDLLNEEECSDLIENVESYHLDVQHGLSFCHKACFEDEKLADKIQKKIDKALQCNRTSPEDFQSEKFFIENEEEYKEFVNKLKEQSFEHNVPIKLIKQLRYIVYPSGGFIGPHTDGVRVCPDEGKQTAFTLIIYLKDSESGHTRFLSGTTKDYVELCSLQPKRGSALIFRHHLLHMGDGVGPEGKILLRGDIIGASHAENS